MYDMHCVKNIILEWKHLIFLFSDGSNLQSRLLEDGVVKGKGDGDRSLSSAMGSIPEETLEDIKGESML